MDHPNLAVLQKLVDVPEANLDYGQITDAFRNVVAQNDHDLTMKAIALSLSKISFSTPLSLFYYISTSLPISSHRMERIRILVLLPQMIWKIDDMRPLMAKYVSRIIMERDPEEYQLEKQKFAHILLGVATSPSTRAAKAYFFEEERLNVLEYIEKHLKLRVGKLEFMLSNDMYANMATIVSPTNFPKFWEILMSSNKYNYYSLLGSITWRVYDRTLTIEDAVQFMIKKLVGGCRTDGPNEKLREIIFNQFVLALVRMASISDLEDVLHYFYENPFQDSVLYVDDVARKHFAELQAINVSPINVSKTLEILVRQAALLKYRDDLTKWELLEKLVRLEPYTEDMTDDERRMYFACLAISSYPRSLYRSKKGSMVLFRKLARRLLELIPGEEQVDVDLSFNEYENIMFAMHQLYTINVPHHEILYDLDENWRKKLRHTLDMHSMTAHKMLSSIELETDPAAQIKLMRERNVITNLETLLVYIFEYESLPRHDLDVALHYHSDNPGYQFKKFIDCFKTETIIKLIYEPSDADEDILHDYIDVEDDDFPEKTRQYYTCWFEDANDDSDDSDGWDDIEDEEEEESESDTDEEIERPPIPLNFARRGRPPRERSPIPPGHARMSNPPYEIRMQLQREAEQRRAAEVFHSVITWYFMARKDLGRTPWNVLQHLEVTPAMYEQQLQDYGNPGAPCPWRVD